MFQKFFFINPSKIRRSESIAKKKILTISRMENIKKEETNKQLQNLSGKLMKDSNRLIYSVENIIGTFYIKCENQL